MVQGNALIGGNEGVEDKIWPSDWPCTCGHLAKQHDFDQIAFIHTACLVRGPNVEMAGAHWEDDCGQFDPIDNLTYVEFKANAKLSK